MKRPIIKISSINENDYLVKSTVDGQYIGRYKVTKIIELGKKDVRLLVRREAHSTSDNGDTDILSEADLNDDVDIKWALKKSTVISNKEE